MRQLLLCRLPNAWWACADLVAQVIAAGEQHGVQLLAENALEGGIYNAEALERMALKSKHFDRSVRSAQHTGISRCADVRDPV